MMTPTENKVHEQYGKMKTISATGGGAYKVDMHRY
jgi:hypothetical protein